MNKEYIYIDGKVEVTDEFGVTKNIDYSDNIDEILVKENLIEQMELEHRKLKKEKKHNKNISFKLLSKSIFILFMIPIFLIALPILLGITELAALPLLGCICAVVIPSFLSFFLIHDYHKTNKINTGIDAGLNYLENELNTERENLKKLKENKKEEIINVSVSKRVDDIKELKKLKKMLMIYYHCGYHQNKYQKYLEQGKLKKKLLKYYNEEQIQVAEEYLKRKQV